ncbi:MAG TPA: twin-arginine translocase TatA/TatE family subunit [Nevskiaceae bacterium]|nr:twin-arginine translocase TatA/TatE family subunit [Nevskiaceae bacterium]
MGNFAFLDLGTPELVLILLIALLLFGGRKLPELSKSLGSSMRELRKGLSEGDNEKNQKQSEEKASRESVS